MRFKIDKEPLLKLLQRTQGIVEKRTSMPILSNILLRVESDRIEAEATDLEIFIKDSCEASVEKGGSLTVNSRKLFEIVKELSGEIDVSASESGVVTIKGGRARFKIPGLDAKEFPAFPAYEESILAKVDSETLSDMINRTLFATSTDETRYNINGVFFEKEEDKLRMIATDGHRLAMIETAAGGVPGAEKGVILPRKGVTEIRKLIEDVDGDLEMGFSGTSVVAKKGATVINLRLIEGEFPDYRQVIPKENTNIFTVKGSELLSSLKRVSILSSDKIKGVKLNLTKGKLKLSSSTPESGEATEEVDVGYDGEPIEIAFNARYFVEALEIIEADEVSIALKEHLSPALLKIPGDDNFIYVVMPMRL